MSEITLISDTIDVSLIKLLSSEYIVIIESDNESIVIKLHKQ